MNAIFDFVGGVAAVAIALALIAACFDYAFRALPLALRASIAVVVRGAGVRRIRNAIRGHNGRCAELLRDGDRWCVRALWLEKQLYELRIPPEHPPSGMTPEQARQAQQDAVRAAFGDPA